MHRIDSGCLIWMCCHVAQDALGPRTSVFLSDVETDVWAPGLVAELAARSARCAGRPLLCGSARSSSTPALGVLLGSILRCCHKDEGPCRVRHVLHASNCAAACPAHWDLHPLPWARPLQGLV